VSFKQPISGQQDTFFFSIELLMKKENVGTPGR
jgi:hypothetical protein